MKKQIVLESPIVVSFNRVKIKPALARAARACHPMSNAHLDAPPNGNAVHRAIELKLAFETVPRRTDRPQRILVVEDETSIRQIYSCALAHCGFQVDTAEDGEEGWNALRNAVSDSNGYDLLITDNNMPNLSGVGLIQKLRSARIELPVILASGALPADSDHVHVAAILPKPFPLDLLIKTVKEILHVAKNE